MIILNEQTSKELKFFYPRVNEVFPLFSWCGEFTCKQDFFISRENPGYFVAIFTTEGEGELTIGKKSFTLKPNTIAIIPSDENYSYRPLQDGWRFKFAHLHGSITSSACREIVASRSPVFPFFDKGGAFDEFFNCVKRNADEPDAVAITQRFLHSLYYGEQTNAVHPVIEKTKEFVISSLSNDLSVDNLSRNAGLSRPYFTRLFTVLTGKTPSAFVTEERLKKAKELLYTTSLSITEISSLVGYQDLSSFVRLFKKSEGITPLALRKSNPYL